MAIRKSTEEELVVSGNRDEWMSRCADALNSAGFKKVIRDNLLFQVQADYKKLMTWGDIVLTMLPFSETETKIKIFSTANVDNFGALFKSPSKTIIQKFKENI